MLASYDTHFIINQLAEEFKGELDCTGENMEKYITFFQQLRKNVVKVKQLHTNWGLLRVSDLCRLLYQNLLIMSGNFDGVECKSYTGNNRCEECKKLIEGLIKTFPSLYQFCNGDLNKFILLLQKGVYPYEYMDSWEKSDETT